MKQRDEELEKRRKKREIEVEETISRELTLRPVLSTSPAMQPLRRSKSGEDISTVLFKYDKIYKENRLRLQEKREKEIAAESYFIPKISPSSKKILSHRKNQPSLSTITMSVNGLDDLSIFNEENDAMVDEGDKNVNGILNQLPISDHQNGPATPQRESFRNHIDQYSSPNERIRHAKPTIVFTATSPMHVSVKNETNQQTGDQDDALSSFNEMEIFTPEEASQAGFEESKYSQSSPQSINSHQRPSRDKNQQANLNSGKADFIKHVPAGVLMRRPNLLPSNRIVSNSFNGIRNGGLINHSDESSSSTTESGIRRFDAIFQSELKQSQSISIINSKASSNQNRDRISSSNNSNSNNHKTLNRSNRNILVTAEAEVTSHQPDKQRARSRSPTTIPRKLRLKIIS